MKTLIQNRTPRAFTLIEMVGVLAVIALLASMLTPKIMSSINDARLGSTVGSLDALKAATVSYYSKNGSLPLATVAAPKFDKLLVTAEFLERPFECKIGPSLVQSVAGSAAGISGAGYKLDGDTVFTTTAEMVVQCVLSGVLLADALELSKRIDGAELSVTDGTGKIDDKGRVVYNYTSTPNTVYIYIAHR